MIFCSEISDTGTFINSFLNNIKKNNEFSLNMNGFIKQVNPYLDGEQKNQLNITFSDSSVKIQFFIKVFPVLAVLNKNGLTISSSVFNKQYNQDIFKSLFYFLNASNIMLKDLVFPSFNQERIITKNTVEIIFTQDNCEIRIKFFVKHKGFTVFYKNNDNVILDLDFRI